MVCKNYYGTYIVGHSKGMEDKITSLNTEEYEELKTYVHKELGERSGFFSDMFNIEFETREEAKEFDKRAKVVINNWFKNRKEK